MRYAMMKEGQVGRHHGRAVGHVCEKSQLELAVVGDDELVALLAREGISNLQDDSFSV